MASNTVLPISNAKRGAQSDSKSAKLPQSSVRAASAASLQELKIKARRCHTPKQFRELLEHLRAFIPFQKFSACGAIPRARPSALSLIRAFPVTDSLASHDRRVMDQSSVSRMASDKANNPVVRCREAPEGTIGS